MLLMKYISKEIFKNQLYILLLLFLVCFCQKFIRILGLNNNISIYSVFFYLVCNVPELGKLIIPFSLFLSVLITCYRLHMRNEILAIYSCAVSKCVLIQSILLCSSVVSVLAIISMFWLLPHCEQRRNSMLLEIKKNIGFIELTEKKFQVFFNRNMVLFIDSINNKKLCSVFIAIKQYDKKNQDMLTVITADQGKLEYVPKNFQLITLKTGVCYNICNDYKSYQDICISTFSTYQVLLNYDLKSKSQSDTMINCMFIKQLWRSSLLKSCVELHWRLTLLVSIFIMPIISLLLMINIVYSYWGRVVLAMILYIVFFVLHILLCSFSVSMEINLIMWMWLINVIYLIIAVLINFWKTIFRRI